MDGLTEEMVRLASATPGFLSPEEGERLYRLATAAASLGPCLEIGGYCGKSTIYLGSACRAGGTTLFCVDTHRGSEEQQPGELFFDPALFDPVRYQPDTFARFQRTLAAAELERTVVPIVCRSEIAARHWRTPLALVFIDGGHALETVRTDYEGWAPHLIPGGWLVFHDIYPDPAEGGQAPRRVYETALAAGGFREHPMTGSLGVLQRIGSAAGVAGS